MTEEELNAEVESRIREMEEATEKSAGLLRLRNYAEELMRELGSHGDYRDPDAVIARMSAVVNRAEAEFSAGILDYRRERAEAAVRDAVAGGDIDGIRNALSELDSVSGSRKIETFADFVRSDWQRGLRYGTGPLGYQFNRFRNFEKRIDGLQTGLHGIIAGPNVGKSVLMVNLMMDLLESNGGIRILFVTLDDRRDVTLHYAYALLTDLVINKTFPGRIEGQALQLLEESRDRILELADRMEILDGSEVRTVADLDAAVRRFDADAAFVDAALKFAGGQADKRVAAEMASDGMKRIAETHDIPVVFSHEIRKVDIDRQGKRRPLHLDDTKETMQVAYDMKTGLILEPVRDSDLEDEDVPELELKLKYAKNKSGSFRGTDYLRFTRAKATMMELEKPTRMEDQEDEVSRNKTTRKDNDVRRDSKGRPV